jgi:hypothetical protein
MTPLNKVEALYEELVAHYGEGEDRELRAAAKLMLVALDKFKAHGGQRGIALADEYLDLLKLDPDKFDRIISTSRNEGETQWLA